MDVGDVYPSYNNNLKSNIRKPVGTHKMTIISIKTQLTIPLANVMIIIDIRLIKKG
jgi:hypothetical protein